MDRTDKIEPKEALISFIWSFNAVLFLGWLFW